MAEDDRDKECQLVRLLCTSICVNKVCIPGIATTLGCFGCLELASVRAGRLDLPALAAVTIC